MFSLCGWLLDDLQWSFSQDRLEGIVDQLKTLGSKQEEIKNQIEEANERQNFQVVSQLQNQLEMIVGHHIQLVNEKVELENQQKQIEMLVIINLVKI